jgi:hypothetical protein
MGAGGVMLIFGGLANFTTRKDTTGQTALPEIFKEASGTAVGVLAMLGLVLSATATAASATPATATAPAATAAQTTAAVPDGAVQVGMRVTGFNAEVARANGYIVKTDAQGRQYSVKPGAAGERAAIPVIWGNCGMSWVYYNAIGNSSATINTGFSLYWPAVSYWWFVRINDAGGQNNHIWAGGLNRLYGWSAFKTVPGLSHGLSVATVSTASSAILADGRVCTSGGPSDLDNVY